MGEDDLFESIKKETEDVVNLWNEQKPDGWSGMFQFVFSATGDLVEVVEASNAVAKNAKKDTVVSALQYAYKQVNPDLPWIPEPFETRIEEWVLDNAVPVLIDWIVSKYNDHGIFAHG